MVRDPGFHWLAQVQCLVTGTEIPTRSRVAKKEEINIKTKIIYLRLTVLYLIILEKKQVAKTAYVKLYM